jgi:prepilin-type N-terminal cleavage/methylation domain-containing protein
VFETLFEKHRELQRQRAEEGFDGFTLIELLIVIVVIAILAATVIFALGGVTGSSAQAACNSDAKSVEVAVEAYKNFPGNGDVWPGASAYAAGPPATTTSVLTGNGGGGPYLRTFPQPNSHYTISTDASGNVFVTAGNNVAPSNVAANNYDAATNPCNTVQ